MGEKFVETVLLLFVGMSVVLLSLSFLAGMIWVAKMLDERFNLFRIRKYSEQVGKKQVEEETNDEIVAVLAAAATALLKRPVRIRRVQFLSSGTNPAWAVTGRLNIMASHALPKRR